MDKVVGVLQVSSINWHYTHRVLLFRTFTLSRDKVECALTLPCTLP